MKLEIAKKWTKALRSGKYKKGKGALKESGRYCCLGVLCDISKQGQWEKYGKYITKSKDDNAGILSRKIRVWSGMKSNSGNFTRAKVKTSSLKIKNSLSQGCSLTTINDNTRASFKEIATFIENNYKIL